MRPVASLRRAGRRQPASRRRWSVSWPTSPCRARASKSVSPVRRCRPTAGRPAGSTKPSSTCLPNPGEDLRPLARIVSGGEMSRIMLGIKSLASIDEPGKTLIFDEVDAGIGGRVADAVGGKLRALGRRVPGPLHHASPADRRLRRVALPHREARPKWSDHYASRSAEGRRPRGGTGAHDWRHPGLRCGPPQRAGDAGCATGRKRIKIERRKRKSRERPRRELEV